MSYLVFLRDVTQTLINISVCLVTVPGRTQFYQDAQLYYGDEMKPPYKQSCFTDLHTKYGEIIDRVLDSLRSSGKTVTNRETTSVASSDTLIQF